MNNQQKYVKVIENDNTAVYSWQEKGDSQGYHIFYSGPRGNFTTTHLGFYSVVKDCLKRGLKIIGSNFNNIEEVIEKATVDIQHEKEINERWQRDFGHNCILI